MNTKTQLNNLKILIVDDDQFVLDLNHRILADAGYRDITAVTDGTGAIDNISKMTSAFDLIIFDLKMPGVSGFELIHYMSNNNVKSALIILSGESEDSINNARSMVAEGGLQLLGILQKPLEKEKLKKLLTDNFC